MSAILGMLLAPSTAIGTAALTGQTLSTSVTSPETATCTVALETDGEIRYDSDSPPAVPAGEWNSEEPRTDVGDGWETMFESVSGDSPNVGDSLGTWHRIDSERNVGMSSSSGSRSGVVKISVRPHGGGTVVSANFDLTAEAT